MTYVTSSNFKEKMTVSYLLSLTFLLVVADLSFDISPGLPMKDIFFDFLLEGAILLTVIITAQYVWRKFKTEKQTKEFIQRDLEETKKQAKKWEAKSKSFIKEFQGFVFNQFEIWNLSKSEKEIALLILNGKTSKDIAGHRFTSERTVRNQCRSIYEKSNLSGKNEFSAFFLNELLEDISL